MDEREILRIAVRHDIDSYLTEALTLEFVRDVLKAARRTTPDREAIIEECAKVCDARAHRGDTARGGMGQIFADTQDEEARSCANAIRALKTAPTSDKGGA